MRHAVCVPAAWGCPVAELKVQVSVHMAWWWPLYCHGVACMCWLTGQDFDPDKVRAMATRAMRVRFGTVDESEATASEDS